MVRSNYPRDILPNNNCLSLSQIILLPVSPFNFYHYNVAPMGPLDVEVSWDLLLLPKPKKKGKSTTQDNQTEEVAEVNEESAEESDGLDLDLNL